VALLDDDGDVVERYEYDAYGACRILDDEYDPRTSTQYANPYLFTGRRLDILDGGSLKIQYNRERCYDSETGRWLTHDPLGITPNPPKPNEFDALGQYRHGINLYLYVKGNPLSRVDAQGLFSMQSGFTDDEVLDMVSRSKKCCKKKETPSDHCERRRIFPDCCPEGWTKVARSECDCFGSITGRLKDRAFRKQAEVFTRDEIDRTDMYADAYLHCIWVCRIRQELGYICSVQADLKEWKDSVREKDWTPARNEMDLDNNAEGRRLGKDCSRNCADSCKDALLFGDLTTIDDYPSPSLSPSPPVNSGWVSGAGSGIPSGIPAGAW